MMPLLVEENPVVYHCEVETLIMIALEGHLMPTTDVFLMMPQGTLLMTSQGDLHTMTEEDWGMMTLEIPINEGILTTSGLHTETDLTPIDLMTQCMKGKQNSLYFLFRMKFDEKENYGRDVRGNCYQLLKRLNFNKGILTKENKIF